MNLWIRSQDREFLMKIDNISLGCENDGKINEARRLFTFKMNTSFTLGAYSSKERALEVLNNIQNKLENNILQWDSDGYPCLVENTTVYEMPKE